MIASKPRVLRAGDRALLVELPDLEHTLGMFDALNAADLPGVLELVPAARTVLVRFDPLLTASERLAERILGLSVHPGAAADGRRVRIGVHYDGADLAEVADLLGITEREVVLRHTGSDYRVAFGGFAPGFAYLTGGDPVLDVPRRSTPRTRIPAGAVGLAGTFSGVYPRESPGGWQLIGHTDDTMWDLDRDPPATLQPGDRVTFVDLDAAPTDTSTERVTPGETPSEAPAPSESESASQPDQASDSNPTSEPDPTTASAELSTTGAPPHLQIVHPGALALLQDGGRPGLAAMGVACSGALDRRSLHTANRLVGNPADSAAIEFSFGGEVRSIGDLVVAVAGEELELTLSTADGARFSVIDQRPLVLHDGDTLALTPTLGARGYLAVRGGFDLPDVLGSRSTDTLSRIGPPALAAGAALGVGSLISLAPVQDPHAWPGRLSTQPVALPLLLGPRDDWFAAEAVELLFEQAWTVSPRSDRVGIRLVGDCPLERSAHGELPSEGTVTGAVQIPPDGQPVLFLADHPVTGGYPVIAVLHSSALDLAGQLAPGSTVHFTRTTTKPSSIGPTPGAEAG